MAIKNVKLNDEPKDAEDNFKESRKDICTCEERQNQFAHPVCKSTVNKSL